MGYDLDDVETFDKRLTPYKKRPQVTIQGAGAFSMNAAARSAMGDPEAVLLQFSKRQNIIVLKPVSPDDPHAYPLRAQGANATTFLVAARKFLMYYEIPFGSPVKYDAKIVEGALVLDLNEEGYDATSNRGRVAGQDAAPNGSNEIPVSASDTVSMTDSVHAHVERADEGQIRIASG